MPIVLHVDDLLREKGATVTQLADAIGISRVNASHIKTGNVKALRFSTLEAICEYLDCQPGDIIEYVRAEQPLDACDVRAAESALPGAEGERPASRAGGRTAPWALRGWASAE